MCAHCRIEDDDYMQTMGIGAHSFAASHEAASQEYAEEEGLDNDEEGFVPKGRAANYTTLEDILICDAFKKVGMDAGVGVEQPKEAYWMRMWEYFVSRNKSGIDRNMGSIRHRWNVINADCQKWAGCLANVDRLNPSGTNANDRVSLSFVLLLIVICCMSLLLIASIVNIVEQHGTKHVQGEDQEGAKRDNQG